MKEADETAAWNMPIGACLPLVIDGVAGKYRVVKIGTVDPGWIDLKRLS